MIRTVEGLALRIVSPGGGQQSRIETVEAPSVEEPSAGRVNLRADDVRMLFEGRCLAKSRRIAALTPTRFALIFGRSCDGGTYDNAAKLRAIGRGITDPLVIAKLADRPQRHLEIVARERDPYKQLEVATQVLIDEATAKAQKKAERDAKRRNGR